MRTTILDFPMVKIALLEAKNRIDFPDAVPKKKNKFKEEIKCSNCGTLFLSLRYNTRFCKKSCNKEFWNNPKNSRT